MTTYTINKKYTMEANKFLPSLLFVALISVIYNCSPAPMLQSPRVKSKISLGVSGMRDMYDQNKEEEIWEIHPLNLKLGFFERMDITGVFIPINHHVISGNIKIFIMEHGYPVLFKNVSYALFCGKKDYGWEPESESTAYIGTIFANRHTFSRQELELIIQPSYYKLQYQWNGAPGGKPDSKADGMQINFGAILTPYKSNKMNIEIITGGMYRYIRKNEFEIYQNYHDMPEWKDLSRYTRWVIQAGIILNFK